MVAINYTPDGQTLIDFMRDRSLVRGLQGPIGSGKSAACVMECLRLMLGQERAINMETGLRTGPRKVRVGVIRNTTPQLETTTMKTWLEWLPENVFGPVRWRAPFRQTIRLPEIDLEAEVWFLALDRDEDVRKLLSFEFTFIWLNEARELSREIVTAAISRVKRYPRMIEGGPTRACVIMDTNAPDEEHWWAIMSGQAEPPEWMGEEDRLTLIRPEGWTFFTQPPALFDRMGPDGVLQGYDLNPNRENGKYTDQTYYTGLLHGQTRDWIRNMLQNQIGRLFKGRPVYQGFNEVLHVAKEAFGPVPNETIHVGVDFGLTPAAAFGQDLRGQVRVFDELVTRDMHAKDFAKLLKKHIAKHYAQFKVVITGDPAGEGRAGTDGLTSYQVLAAEGVKAQPCWTNDPIIRTGAIQTQLNTMVDGRPAYLLSPACTYLLNAKKGGYAFLKDREEVDKKSIFSHVSDAEQYMAVRMGYGRKLVRTGDAAQRQSVQANRQQNLFNRGGSNRKLARQSTLISRGLRG
ncbi:hypothetical protein GEU84_020785 [Fertoebacter nigrum]|uniref:TerL n=1 Tax=Fertoeibacter niger TaxID=2656921 RepID=A0A8X8GYX7_9RHOB|nr:hypothetical protein [Fertoeibacter niger]NUB46824.1 hypothetical protein [Fertoeibacter niger]